MEEGLKASDIIRHENQMETIVVNEFRKIMETSKKYWKAVDERLDRQQQKKEEK